MPTARLVQIAAWSYSRFSTYDACPAKAKYLYIDKLKEPDSSAGAEGTRVHALAAAYTIGRLPPDVDDPALKKEIETMLKTRKLPPELETFSEEFAALKKAKASVEQQWCFTSGWEPTGWFDRDAWLRIKVDVHWLTVEKGRSNGLRKTRVSIRDHKTGKITDDHCLQRSLYALGAFLRYPDAVAVDVSHWYLSLGKESPLEKWTRDQLEDLKADWSNRTHAMLNDTTYAPNPTRACGWCAFSAAKKGPCQY